MKKIANRLLALLLVLIAGCGSAQVTLFNEEVKYPPTDHIDIYTDLNSLHKEYFEIGYVSSEGGQLTSQQRLLKNMIEKAKQCGANALIKVSFGTVQELNRGNLLNQPVAQAVMIRYR